MEFIEFITYPVNLQIFIILSFDLFKNIKYL